MNETKYKIYLKNYDHINKSFVNKSRAYRTHFEKEMVNLWILDDDLIINKTRTNIKNSSNISLRWSVADMEFIYNDGFLVSTFLYEMGCKNYKFKCIY